MYLFSPLIRQQLKSIRETRLISCTLKWEISKIASRHTLRRMDCRPKTKISCVPTKNLTSSSISRVRVTPRKSIVLPIHLPARNVVARAPRSLISVEHPALVNAWYLYLYTWDPIHWHLIQFESPYAILYNTRPIQLNWMIPYVIQYPTCSRHFATYTNTHINNNKYQLLLVTL